MHPPSSDASRLSVGRCRPTCSDLFVEFRNRLNGITPPAGFGLLGALTYFGLDNIGATEKDTMRDLVLRGGPWDAQKRADIFDYCAGDVDALTRLLPVMLPRIDLPRALLRGRYIKAAAAMEWNGVPIDTDTLALLRERWTGIQDQLIAEIDSNYGVFDGRTFKAERFDRYLAEHGIPWPRLESGRLDLGDGTFRQMAKAHPLISPLRELRSALSDLRLNDLQVGDDGRNRALLSAFRSRTGRNQPSNSKFIFGPAVWIRSLISRRGATASPTLIGRNRNLASRPRYPAIRICRPPTSVVIHIWNLPNRPAPFRRMLPSNRMAQRGNCSNNACSRRNTAWNSKAWRRGSACRP
jgi:hypothetical protein